MQYRMRQWPLMIAIILLSASCTIVEAAVSVKILGETVETSPAPRVDDGVLLGAPASIVGKLGCRFISDDDDGLVIITPTGTRVSITPGQDTLTVDGREMKMRRTAFVAGGRLIAPLMEVLEAIGAVGSLDQRVGVFEVGVAVRDISVYADERGARVRVEAPLRVQGRLFHLENPERYYVDLPGVKVDLEYDRTLVNKGNLRRVRWAQFGDAPAAARIVLDMHRMADVRWEPDEAGLGGTFLIDDATGEKALIERRVPEITGLMALVPNANKTIVRLETSDPVEVEYDVHPNPPRVVMKLPDATLAAAVPSIGVDGAFVRLAQLEGAPGKTGVTLTLQLHQLIHFEIDSTGDTSALNVVFRRSRLADKRIVVDAGHGGRDSGARGRYLLEKEVNLDVAHRVAARLMEMGAQTTMTRESDVFVDLYDRPRLANRIGADLFVSIHCNAMPRRNTGRGTETYYYHMYSKTLGLVMQQELVRALGRRDNGLRWANFCVTRETSMPGVLVELMYLNNDAEEALLARPDVRAAAAEGIVEGLRRYVEGTGGISERIGAGM